MAILSPNQHTLASYRTRENPDSTVAAVTEILNQQKPAIADIPFIECNNGDQNITYLRTELPTVTVGQVAGGFAASRSEVSQVKDITSRLHALSVVDKSVVELNGNGPGQRALEARSFLEALGQKFEDLLFNGDSSTDPLIFNGLRKRYSAISGNAERASQIVDAGGTGTDNASMIGVVWGPQTVHAIYPKATEMGIKHEMANDGKFVTRSLANGNVVQEYQDFWTWHIGLALKDWRAVSRVANIDVSNLVAESSAADLYKALVRLWYRIEPVMGLGTPNIYVPRTVGEMLDMQARNGVSTGGQLGYGDFDGKKILAFRGIPIRVTDRLGLNEARVV